MSDPETTLADEGLEKKRFECRSCGHSWFVHADTEEPYDTYEYLCEDGRIIGKRKIYCDPNADEKCFCSGYLAK